VQLKGVRVTHQSRSRWLESFDQRTDPRGVAYYWLRGGRRQRDPAPDSDEQAVRAGYVSVTPLSIDLTSYQHLEALEGLQSHAP
jgi:5'-nucleotidase